MNSENQSPITKKIIKTQQSLSTNSSSFSSIPNLDADPEDSAFFNLRGEEKDQFSTKESSLQSKKYSDDDKDQMTLVDNVDKYSFGLKLP